jgi:hypothetical protein
MTVQLFQRYVDRHLHIKECVIEGTFKRYGKVKQTKDWWRAGELEINEELLLASLPKGFLPVDASDVLVTVSEGNSGTALNDLKIFRSWVKALGGYQINLVKRK